MSNVIRGLGAYERDQLIKRYITLLDAIEQHHLKDGDRAAELDLISEASSLIGATLGKIGRISFEKPEDGRDAAMTALMNWRSAFARKIDASFWDEMISELMRLEFGDLPEMLKPANRKKNQHPLGGRLMFMRITAVGWQEFFRKNYPTKAEFYQTKIAEAYGVQFETIDTWRVDVKKYFGCDFFDSWLAHASSGRIDAFTSEEYPDFLERDGQRFRQLSRKPKK